MLALGKGQAEGKLDLAFGKKNINVVNGSMDIALFPHRGYSAICILKDPVRVELYYFGWILPFVQ